MNASELRDARIHRWGTEFGGGAGFETYQVVMGIAVFLIVTFAFLVLGQIMIGLGLAIAAGYGAAMVPNRINTHHKDAKAYLRGKLKQHFQATLVLNDMRVKEPPDDREAFSVIVREFSTEEEE